ncbi:MAG: hypothetical protein ACMXYG_06960 [Candidatus Woesearchaeota archaeon]
MSVRDDREYRYRKSRNKKVVRPKTFKTEESAKKYAESKSISKYKLVNLRSSDAKIKKLKIVQE